jgi:hypothetical protein
MSNSNIATILVGMDLFAQMLHLPEGHQVIDVRRVDKTPYRTFEILCMGPSLPLVADFADIPQVPYTVTVTEPGRMVRERTYQGAFDVGRPACGQGDEWGHKP